jgi:hypothetical protein
LVNGPKNLGIPKLETHSFQGPLIAITHSRKKKGREHIPTRARIHLGRALMDSRRLCPISKQVLVGSTSLCHCLKEPNFTPLNICSIHSNHTTKFPESSENIKIFKTKFYYVYFYQPSNS